jgi:REP element-mobilizing transposase RayT
MAEKIWHEIPNQFPFVELGDFVVMPNHIHGILILNKPVDVNGGRGGNGNGDGNGNGNGDGNGDGVGDAVGGAIGDAVGGAVGDAIGDAVGGAIVETRLIASLRTGGQSFEQTAKQIKTGGFAGNKNPMKNDNISRIIRWYKGRCSFEIRKNHADFGWQSRFHDHIIRNDAEYQRISDYIINNPANWVEDKFYSA